jgi:hypothetical protein
MLRPYRTCHTRGVLRTVSSLQQTPPGLRHYASRSSPALHSCLAPGLALRFRLRSPLPMACPLDRSWPTTAITVIAFSCRIVAPLLALVLTILDVTTAQLRSRLARLWYDGTQEHAMSMIRFQGVGVVG